MKLVEIYIIICSGGVVTEKDGFEAREVVRSCGYGDLDAVSGDESGYVYHGNEVAR